MEVKVETVLVAGYKVEKAPIKINRGIAFIIYADPGVGKTTLATTLEPEETLIINTEAGLGPVLGKNHSVFNVLKFVENNELEKVIDSLYRYLRTEKHPFKNVVIDNMSELEQQLILNLTQRRKKDTPEIREYGDSSYKIKEWVHNYRDLVYNGINVIFNAWEFPLELRRTDGCTITKTFPLIGKRIAPQVCGVVDVVGHLESNEKTQQRRVVFAQSSQFITKSQFKGLDDAEDANLPAIIKKLKDYDYSEKKEEG